MVLIRRPLLPLICVKEKCIDLISFKNKAQKFTLMTKREPWSSPNGLLSATNMEKIPPLTPLQRQK